MRVAHRSLETAHLSRLDKIQKLLEIMRDRGDAEAQQAVTDERHAAKTTTKKQPRRTTTTRKRPRRNAYDCAPHGVWWKVLAVQDRPAAYQLVGGVMAYQGNDG